MRALEIELAPRLRALRVASPTPCRGQHQRPGEASSAVFLLLAALGSLAGAAVLAATVSTHVRFLPNS